MKTLYLLSIAGVLLAGCAQIPVPYKVSKVTDHPSTLLPVQFPLGVTQEKLKPNQYRITAKLAELGTPKRARNMALYHASVLAEQQGYDAFVINKKWDAAWCGSRHNKKTKSVGYVEGGPSAKLIVTLVNAANSSTKKLRLVEKVKVSSRAEMDRFIPQEQLKQIQEERTQHCYAKAKKRALRS